MDQAPVQPDQQQPVQPGPADPKSKEMFKQIILAGMKLVYDPAMAKSLVEMMRSQSDNPAQAVAHAAMAVIGKMKESVKGIPPDSVFTAAPAIMVMLFDIAKAAQLFEADKNTFSEAIRSLGQMVGQPQEAAPEEPPQTAPTEGVKPAGLIAGAMQPGA